MSSGIWQLLTLAASIQSADRTFPTEMDNKLKLKAPNAY
jgi:hypothetical protein